MPVFIEFINIDELDSRAIIDNLKHFFDNPQEVRSICKISEQYFLELLY